MKNEPYNIICCHGEQYVYLVGLGAMVPLMASIHASLSELLTVSSRYALCEVSLHKR